MLERLVAISCVLSLSGTAPLPARADKAIAPDYENGRILCSERVVPRGNSSIVSFSPDGADRQVLLRDGLNIHPNVSRDGKRMLFSRQTPQGSIEIFEMSVEGGQLKQLTRNTPGGNIKAVYSPDGSRIAFMGVRHETGHPEVWIMNADGSGMKRLTRTKAVPGQQEIGGRQHVSSGHPTFSADGRRIYYSSTQSGSVQIWVMNADGSNPRQLTKGLGQDYPQANVPNASLNGERIVFWSGFEGRFGEIWLADAAHWDRPQKLTETEDPANSDDPVISPDGKKVVFGRGMGGDRSMYLLDIETRKISLLASGIQYCSWQPIPRGKGF